MVVCNNRLAKFLKFLTLDLDEPPCSYDIPTSLGGPETLRRGEKEWEWALRKGHMPEPKKEDTQMHNSLGLVDANYCAFLITTKDPLAT